jgi:rubrerythrin
MKARIPFFAEAPFKEEETEAASLFSVLMDEEFRSYQRLRTDFLKRQGLIILLLAVVGGAFILFDLLPVTLTFLIVILIFAAIQYRRFNRLKPRRFVKAMGKFYWPLSLFPFEEGTILLDHSSFTSPLELTHSFVDDQDLTEMKDLRKETTELFSKEDILLEAEEKEEIGENLSVYGIEKRVREIFQRAIDMAHNHREEAVNLPVIDASQPLNQEVAALLRSTLPFRKSEEAQATFIEEIDGEAAYNDFMNWYDFFSQYKKNNLENKWSGWLGEMKKYTEKHGRMLKQNLFADFRKDFMEESLHAGYNHYCPECNRNAAGRTDDWRTFPLDENSRMRLTRKNKWQCPVCGHLTASPLKVSKLYDEVIFPVTRLLVLDDQNKKTADLNGFQGQGASEPLSAEVDRKLYTRVFALLKEDFDQRLTNEKGEYDQTFSQVLSGAETAIQHNRKAHLVELNEELSQEWTMLLEKRDQLREKMDALKIDLCIPEPLHIGIPLYCARYGGPDSKGELAVLLPAKLTKKIETEGAVNYELVQNEIFTHYKEGILNRMSALLDSGGYKLEKTKRWRTISKGMEKMKSSDLYANNRGDFFDFIEKSHADDQEK